MTLYLVESECIDSTYFISHVYTPVCEDELCYPIILDIKWNLLGYFKGYELPVDSPLTKFDHELFSSEDHLKMRKILSNRYSILRHLRVDDLIDKEVPLKSSVKVDAVTGATKVSLQSEIVRGAVYSTYVLWHLVNGSAADSVRKWTESRIDSSLLAKFVGSNDLNYHFYALEHLTDKEVLSVTGDIINLIEHGEGNVPFFAFDRLPDGVWEDVDNQTRLVAMIGSLDFKLKNAFLNELRDIQMRPKVLNLLISQLDALTVEQQLKVLTITKQNIITLDLKGTQQLQRFLESSSGEVSAQISQVLTLWNNRLQ